MAASLPRRDLVGQVLDAFGRGALLIAVPAGYGKTTLVESVPGAQLVEGDDDRRLEVMHVDQSRWRRGPGDGGRRLCRP